jgi:hypothetical protein
VLEEEVETQDRRKLAQIQSNDRAKQRAEDVKWLMQNEAGRRIMWQLLSDAGVFRSSFTGDTDGMLYKEGKRAIGLSHLGEITAHCKSEFIRMLEEHQTDAD